MPRRSRAGGRSGGCCSCTRYWSAAEEEVAKERIKLQSKKRLVGRYVNWPDYFYDRHRVQRVYIIGGLIGFFVLLALLTFGSRIYEHAMYAKYFKETGCYVSEMSHNFTATCHCQGSARSGRCARDYPCLKVWVEYTVEVPPDHLQRHLGNLTHSSLLFDTVPMMHYTKSDLRCTLHPACDRYRDLEGEVLDFEEHITSLQSMQPFTCLYNPSRPSEVILRREINTAHAELLMLLFALCAAFVGLVILGTCLTCGCQYIWSGTAPPDIAQEAHRRLTEPQGLAGVVEYTDGHVGLPQGPVYPGPPPGYPGPQLGPAPPPGPPGTYPQYGPYPPPQGPPPTAQNYYPPPPGMTYPPPQGPGPLGYGPPPGAYPPPGQVLPPSAGYPGPKEGQPGGGAPPTGPPPYYEKPPLE